MRFITRKTILNCSILIFLFVLSIFVRLDNLKDPMGRHHEWLTGHVLSTNYTFEKDGVFSHYCAPVWTFNTEADRYIVSFQSFKDKENSTYYVSYPPLCFLLPHALFKTFGLSASVIGIRALNLIVHFFIGFVIFLLILKMFKRKMSETLFLPAIMAFAFYTFASGNLWFHGHVWFADMLVPLFIVLQLYFSYSILENEKSNWKMYLLLFVVSFLGAYTEWQMLFVSFAICILFLIKSIKNKAYFKYVLIIGLGTVLSLGTTYLQYTSIAGKKELFDVLLNKYKQRSGGDTQTAEAGLGLKNSFSFENISNHYENNYSVLLDFGWYFFLLFLILLLFSRMKDNKIFTVNHLLIFTIILFSILAHHFIFFNFTAIHDFSSLKIALLISLFSGYVIGFYQDLFTVENKKKNLISFVGINVLLFAVFFHYSTRKYYSVNQISSFDKNHMVIGELVRKHVKPNEVAICNLGISPEATWYAKRNIITAGDFNAATMVLQRIDSKLNAKWVKINPLDFEIIQLNKKGDTLNYYKANYSEVDCLKSK